MRLSRTLTSAAALAMMGSAAAFGIALNTVPLGEQPYGRHSPERAAKPKPKRKRKFKGSRAAKKVSRP